MSAPPAVSVIIPAYKVAGYIAETLDSVFAQTFRDFEVIVVNDGSPDTAEFEREIEPYRGRIVYLKQANLGASAARNAALRTARGEWAAFLDADDVWLPPYLSRQLAFLRERGVDLVSANALIFGQSRAAGMTYHEQLMPDAPASEEVGFLALLGGERSLITSGVVVRRSLVLEAGLFDEGKINAQDFDLWLRLALRKARLAYHDEVLLRYRVHADSLSGDEVNIHRRELEVFDKVESSYPLAPEERPAALAVMRRRRALLHFEIGKLLLLGGDAAGARASFAEAVASGGGWKPRLAGFLVRAAPEWARAAYARRVARNGGNGR